MLSKKGLAAVWKEIFEAPYSNWMRHLRSHGVIIVSKNNLDALRDHIETQEKEIKKQGLELQRLNLIKG